MATPPTINDVTGKAKTQAVDRPRDRALTKSSSAELPAKGVIFVLGAEGHRRAGYSRSDAQAQFNLTMKYAHNISIGTQNELGIEDKPYEIHIFNTLDELVRKRPNASAGGRWHSQVRIVTHAQGEQPQALESSIFFGDRDYMAFDLIEFAAARKDVISGLRDAIAPDATLSVVGCAPASHGPELALNLRELFGLRGAVRMPNVNVGFSPQGFLGTLVPVPETKKMKVRAMRPEEWLEINPIPQENRPD